MLDLIQKAGLPALPERYTLDPETLREPVPYLAYTSVVELARRAQEEGVNDYGLFVQTVNQIYSNTVNSLNFLEVGFTDEEDIDEFNRQIMFLNSNRAIINIKSVQKPIQSDEALADYTRGVLQDLAAVCAIVNYMHTYHNPHSKDKEIAKRRAEMNKHLRQRFGDISVNLHPLRETETLQ